MKEEFKEVWPVVEDPRACISKVDEWMVKHPPPPYQPRTAEERKILARLAHEDAVRMALHRSIELVRTLWSESACVKCPTPENAACWPSCLSEPFRSAWVAANAALLREQETRPTRPT